MKKMMSMVFAVLMAVTVSGCGTEDRDSEKVKIGVVQIMEHRSLDLIRDSFLEEMNSLGYTEDNVTYDIQNAQGEQSNLSTICKKFVGDEVDLIVAIATPTAQAAAAATQEIPIVFSAVTDPVEAKLMTDMEKPDRNVTGTSDAIPVDKVMQLCKELTPDVHKIGFLYTSSEINAQITAEKAIKEAEKMGYQTKTSVISEVSELQQAAQSLAQQTDAIYVPIDNTIAQAMQILSQIGIDYQIPIYTGADSMVNDGGFATVGIEYTELGKQTAQIAKKVLDGTPISEIPAQTMNRFGIFINSQTAQKIGIAIPEEIKRQATGLGE